MIELKPRGDASGASDPDGVRVVARDAAGRRQQLILQGLALFLAGACAGYVLMPRQAPQGDTQQMPPPLQTRQMIEPESPANPVIGAGSDPAAGVQNPAASATATGLASTGSSRGLTPRRTAAHSKENANKKPEEEEEPGQQPELVGITRDVTAGEYIQALHDAGIYEGIGAFNPPGTSPPLEGLEVPDDYELPEGYVRHYQSTDDGQPIKPILMYNTHDYEFLDANGNPVEIPADGVVPADKAPPGFPIHPIEIPKPRERQPGDTGR